eukprot:3629-Alexandrium_andersonii.AAC.1
MPFLPKDCATLMPADEANVNVEVMAVWKQQQPQQPARLVVKCMISGAAVSVVLWGRAARWASVQLAVGRTAALRGGSVRLASKFVPDLSEYSDKINARIELTFNAADTQSVTV